HVGLELGKVQHFHHQHALEHVLRGAGWPLGFRRRAPSVHGGERASFIRSLADLDRVPHGGRAQCDWKRSDLDRGASGVVTTLAEEATRLEALDQIDRVAVETVGTSVEGRPIRVVRIGATEPPTLEDRPEILLVGLQHGNEGFTREALLDLAEHLATTSDPTELDALASSGVVILPTLNP